MGEIKTFTTLTPDGNPAMTTTVASGITTTTATTGGNVQYDGGAPITERGVVYSTSPNPTISGSKITSGNGLGEFTIVLYSLSPSTTYYYRAYATNSTNETGYGGEFSFTTLSANQAPTVVTNSAVEGTTAGGSIFIYSTILISGNVTSDGGSSITSRGFVYSYVDSSPTMGESDVDNLVVSGTTGSFSSDAFPLIGGNTYYVRAYASNINGTSYGDILTFTVGQYNTSTYSHNHAIAYGLVINGVSSSFYSSLSAAQQACYDHLNPGGRTISFRSTTLATPELGVISTGYIPYFYSSSRVKNYLADGYYIEIHDNGVNHYIITVSGGVITSRVSCN